MLIFVISDCYLMLNYITSEVGNLPQQLPTGGHGCGDMRGDNRRPEVKNLWLTLCLSAPESNKNLKIKKKKTGFGECESLISGVSPGEWLNPGLEQQKRPAAPWPETQD